MNNEDFGLWSMFLFWFSAIGGIYVAVKWASRKSKKSPASKEMIIASLKRRLKDGDIDQAEYDKKISELEP